MDDVESLCLTFSIDTRAFGVVTTRDLVPNGRHVDVTADNVAAFLDERLKDRVFTVVREGLDAFLDGVHAVVPSAALMLLSARELELALFGLQDIDVDDWKTSTVYASEYAALGPDHPCITWFWDLLHSWDTDKRAMLLQWVTGTSRVPVQGFDHLLGRDGVLRPFTITSVALAQAAYPRAHTCFNRIDLPLFQDQGDLVRAFDLVLHPACSRRFSMD